MSFDALLGLIDQFGYPALFFSLWLGIVGMPIPDEVIVMTGGFVTALGLLHVIPAFLVTYLGVVFGLSLGYVIGYRVGAPILDKLARKKKIAPYLQKSQEMLDRHGAWALCWSYFLPVVRHVVPYLVGVNRMPFARYALFSYTTGLVWTLVFFIVGRLFGQYIEEIGATVTRYGQYALLAAAGALLILWLVRRLRSQYTEV
ncbi:DedA family protein [Tumebacillus sp. DT12]|uniref:DedA family protein n=1 Tax=Tumebacillus lacus TaxID=2995335 RepID=A0ABT3WYH9_9BACL|nr:DedA family protein [Tumebacillus lacus]MCX7569717.1 DedA family protein [Tumebacillus lacus]